MDRSSDGGSAAFSLVEILVATGLLALIVVMLASVSSFCGKSLTSLRAAASERQDARVVLAMMVRELRAANLPIDRGDDAASAADRQPQFLLDPQGVSAACQNANALFWEASVGSSKGGSGLVGYFVRWEASGQGARPRLCRVFVNAADMQPVLASLRSSSATEWTSDALLDKFAPGDADNGFAGWMADNVIALYARALDPEMRPIANYARDIVSVARSATGSRVTFGAAASGAACGGRFDSRKGYQYTRSSDSALVNRFGPAFPAGVEIVLLVAPPKEIQRLVSVPERVASGDPARMWSDIAAFTAALPLPLRESVHAYSTIAMVGARP